MLNKLFKSVILLKYFNKINTSYYYSLSQSLKVPRQIHPLLLYTYLVWSAVITNSATIVSVLVIIARKICPT